MVNAQEWLKKYNTKQKRAKATKLFITDQLTGELDLTDFTKLEKIIIAQSVDDRQFQITNQPGKVEIIISNSWIDIDERFGENEWGSSKTNQQEWEEAGFTAQDAQDWIRAGFKPDNLYNIQGWKNLNFTADQAQDWRSIGLEKYDYQLAYYCQTKQLTPEVVKDNLEQYKSEFKQELQLAQFYLDVNYPLANRSKIKMLDISEKNLTGDLNLTGFNNLTKLECWNNKLTNLNLSNCSSLTELNCWKNKLTNLNFLNTLPTPKKLTKLDIGRNNITSNLTPLSKLVNLQVLDLRYNSSLATSLAPLQHCLKLEKLNIVGTNLTPDLQYLPLSLSRIICDGKIEEELKLYNDNLTAWQAAHPHLMKQVGKEVVSDYSKSELKTVTTTPEYLTEYLKSATEPVANLTNLDYSHFALRDGRPFVWENKNLATATTLPLRLYNLQTEQVEATEGRTDIKHYLALSYVWGTDWENNKQKYGQEYQTDLTKLGRKALNKAIQVGELINQDTTPINHIWIDNFCINQGDKDEKGQEVAKQQQYYNNASATLIAIDNSVGEAKWESETKLAKHIIQQIITSPWFQRSWTFQEGLLSKQTLFLFDDKIVDGRILANAWGGVQERAKDWINLNTTPTIFITPLGWSYGAQTDQKVELGLSQALDAVKHRGQTVPLDGLYSILGLLPYGGQVQTNYQPQGHKYTEAELNTELQKIMQLAIKNGYSSEPISWFGVRHIEPRWWMNPPLKKDGTSEITGFFEWQSNSIKVSTTGWELLGKKYLVTEDNKETGIIIYPNSKQIKSTNNNKLKITLPIVNKATRPVVFENTSGDYGYNNKFFLDMVNKEVIEGEELITQYQQQLPLIQEQKQSFSLVYDKYGDNVTVNNSLVWQIQEQFYILKNKQLQEIDNLWKTNIHSAFTDPALIRAWTNKHWIYGLVQWWAKELEDEFNPHDYDFYTWVRDVKKIDKGSVSYLIKYLKLEQQFQTYQEQSQAQIEQPPK